MADPVAVAPQTQPPATIGLTPELIAALLAAHPSGSTAVESPVRFAAPAPAGSPLAGAIYAAAMVGVLFFAYHVWSTWRVAPGPGPAPAATIVALTKAMRAARIDAYRSQGAAILSGSTGTINKVLEDIDAAVKPSHDAWSAAMDAEIRAAADSKGTITDKARAAKVLADTAAGWGD